MTWSSSSGTNYLTADDLRQYFRKKYGKITDVTITSDDSGNFSDGGIVEFESASQAAEAYQDGVVMESWHCIQGKQVRCQEECEFQVGFHGNLLWVGSTKFWVVMDSRDVYPG